MNTIFNKFAAGLAFIIGGMAVFAGGKVFLGILPDYNVINWLPVYNYTMGILTVFVTASLIWVNHRLAMPAAIGTFSLHALVMILLQTAFRDVVAPDSIQAMTLRLIVWSVILGLMIVKARRSETVKMVPASGSSSKS